MTPEEARTRYPVLERCAYLNTGTAGPISVDTHRVMAEWEERTLLRGRGDRAYHFEEGDKLRARARAAVGALLSVPAEHVLLTASTTEGCNLVVTGLRLGPEDEVVTTDAEHPGLEEPLRASGARVRVARVLGRTAEDSLAAITAEVTPRTRLVALSHVLWLNGQVLPVDEIRRATGAQLLVDGAQSVGAIPVEAGRVDFYTVSGQKWLCGPELTGALFVADPDRLRPQMASHMATHGEGAALLEVAHHALAAVAGLITAVEELPAWAFARAAEMTEQCRAALVDAGLTVHTPPGHGTLVSFAPVGPLAEAAARCRERDVVVRALPNGWLRASCGWWTSAEDICRLAEAVAGRR